MRSEGCVIRPFATTTSQSTSCSSPLPTPGGGGGGPLGRPHMACGPRGAIGGDAEGRRGGPRGVGRRRRRRGAGAAARRTRGPSAPGHMARPRAPPRGLLPRRTAGRPASHLFRTRTRCAHCLAAKPFGGYMREGSKRQTSGRIDYNRLRLHLALGNGISEWRQGWSRFSSSPPWVTAKTSPPPAMAPIQFEPAGGHGSVNVYREISESSAFCRPARGQRSGCDSGRASTGPSRCGPSAARDSARDYRE